MKFRIELGQEKEEFHKNQAAQFRNTCCDCPDDAGYLFFVDEQPVSRSAAIIAAQDILDSAWNKKILTHKRVRVCIGASRCKNNFHEIWVRR